MSDLRNKLIRLAHSKPELRQHILPLLKQAGTWYGYIALREDLAKDAKKMFQALKKKYHGGNVEITTDVQQNIRGFQLHFMYEAKANGKFLPDDPEFYKDVRALWKPIAQKYKMKSAPMYGREDATFLVPKRLLNPYHIKDY